jgi:hypothetical protein
MPSPAQLQFANQKLKQLAAEQARALSNKNFCDHDSLARKVVQIEDCLERAEQEEATLQAKLDEAIGMQEWMQCAKLQRDLWRVANLHEGEFVQTQCNLQTSCAHGPIEVNAAHWSCCGQPEHDSACCFEGPQLGNPVVLQGKAADQSPSNFGVIVDFDTMTKGDARTIAVAFNTSEASQIFYWMAPDGIVRVPSSDLLASKGGHVGHYHTFDDTNYAKDQPDKTGQILKLIQDPETSLVNQKILAQACDADCQHQQKPEYLHTPLQNHWSCCGERNIYAACTNANAKLTAEVKDDKETRGSKFAFGEFVTEATGDSSGVVTELKLNADADGDEDDSLVTFDNGQTIRVKVQQMKKAQAYSKEGFQYRITSHMRQQDAVFLTASHILRFDSNGNLVGVSTRSLDSCKKFCKHGADVVFRPHWSCCEQKLCDFHHDNLQACGLM